MPQLLDIQTLYGELDDAVRREDFRRAAELKAALRDLEKQDVVGGLLQVRTSIGLFHNKNMMIFGT